MASTSAAKQSSAMKQFPNWLELPHDLMANILQRLRTAEILGARKVCTTWWRICKDPALWKVIDVYKLFDDRNADYGIETLTKQAVHLSCGELIDISISGFGTDDLVDFIVLRSSKLTHLCLEDCKVINGSRLSQAVKRVPQLEKLHLSNIVITGKDTEVIGHNCPQLKSFKMSKWVTRAPINYDDNALAIANNMPELHHLELTDDEMTSDGLEAILSGCPHLETLHLRMCSSVWLEGKLGQLCMEQIKDFKCDFEMSDSSGYDSPGDFDHLVDSYLDEFYADYDYYN